MYKINNNLNKYIRKIWYWSGNYYTINNTPIFQVRFFLYTYSFLKYLIYFLLNRL